MQAYCVKCRRKVEPVQAEKVSMRTKHGTRAAIQGRCPKCGTKTFRFI